MESSAKSGVVVAGGGIAGIAAALELLGRGHQVTLLERAPRERFGGLAREAFGGMLFAGTRLQRLNGIRDSAGQLRQDWERAAEFSEGDHWPRRWADVYAERCVADVHDWLHGHGIRFFPVVQWVERGEFMALNSLPRYHVIWGTGARLVQVLVAALENHPQRARLDLRFGHCVDDLLIEGGRVAGVRGHVVRGDDCNRSDHQTESETFECRADATVVASGGINGNLARVREAWDRARYGEPPENLLNGAHPDGDGHLHDVVAAHGGHVARLGQMWNYPTGIRHPAAEFPGQGLSLIPPRAALWLDCFGQRVGPHPMVTGFDTHDLCRRMGHLPQQYAWLLMNRRIVEKEMAISGSQVNPAFRDRNFPALLRDIIFGNKRQYRFLTGECPDVVTAGSLDELAIRMNEVAGSARVTVDALRNSVLPYDAQIARGTTFHDDDQLRRIAQVRRWRGDRPRTLPFQAILDAGAGPLVVIRICLLSRKSMGGIETDLSSRVLDSGGNFIDGLYAVGECSGFGGGGSSGIRSLEGTFLSGCVLTARIAARAIDGVAHPSAGNG